MKQRKKEVQDHFHFIKDRIFLLKSIIECFTFNNILLSYYQTIKLKRHRKMWKCPTRSVYINMNTIIT